MSISYDDNPYTMSVFANIIQGYSKHLKQIYLTDRWKPNM